jgi:RHS repeat-associated protein
MANVTLNQKQNGGAWVPLGSWNFAPGAGHKVTLAAAAEGTTIADAMLFVAAGAQPANLLYVHADHLGSPQKLTDASQATVWDGVFDPFGEEVAIAGLAAMPMRFPGQYADEETGFSYNYFRDYEPRLGRYVQSDPIGILAGLSPYVYVGARPVSLIDSFGLAGHHIVPQAIYNNAALPAETLKVFDEATSGPIPGGHGWSKEHKQYSDAVGDMWNEWIRKNGIDPTRMTPDRAREFLDMVASSNDPRISGFLNSIEKSIGRKVFSRFLKCGIVVFFLMDATEYGLDYATEAAVDDALWPLNDIEIGMGVGPAY